MKFTGKCPTGKMSFNYSSWSYSNIEVKFAPIDSPMRCSGGVKYDTSSIRPLTPFQNSRLQGYDAFQADKQGSFSLSALSGEVCFLPIFPTADFFARNSMRHAEFQKVPEVPEFRIRKIPKFLLRRFF